MGIDDNGRCVFPLTSLQIGDLQSYLSHLSIFLAPESKRLYILVDNRPWLKDLVSRSTHLWQLMVTKSRLSPFANTRGRKEKKGTGTLSELQENPETSTSESNELRRWFPLINAATLSRRRVLLPVKKLRNSLISNSKLHPTFYGFIVFEVSWNDVRGLNYLNELQTDTSLAVEAKCMRRWEFDSIAQASKCTSSWFSGSHHDRVLLKEYLHVAIGEDFYDAEENLPETGDFYDESGSNHDGSAGDEPTSYVSNIFRVYPASVEPGTNSLHTPPPPSGPYKRRKVMKSSCNDGSFYSADADSETIGSPPHSQTSYGSDSEDIVEATEYRDTLILFRFNDRDLPFKLKDIIMADLRLLTLLESGLPSWVIFLQSYPVFCHLYRPWMCPLARALYVLISIITVLIGFYDLYKNVPLLKATASHLFGPLFDWIETWEMISRIKYLGTMLFLHNFQKAIKPFLMITQTARSFFSVFCQPMAGPFAEFLDLFLPVWSMFMELMESFLSVIWVVVESIFSLFEMLVEILLLPLWYIISVVWTFAVAVLYPVFWILCEIIYAPVRVVFGLSSLVTFLYTCIHDFIICIHEFIGDVWLLLSSIFRFTSGVQSSVGSYQVPMWRSLWNDLFSQVFRAVRSILNGFVAFVTACNRHRLSIYNHAKEFGRRLYRPAKKPGCEDAIMESRTSLAQKPAKLSCQSSYHRN